MNGPISIPTLDELVMHPGKALELPPETARALLCGVAGLLPILIAQSSKVPGQAAPTPDIWLTVDEVVAQFRVTPEWVYRHKKKLPYSQPSRKVLLFPQERLRRWFASRKGD